MGIRDIIVSGSNQGGAVVSNEDRDLALKMRALYHDCNGGDEKQSVKLFFETMQRIIPYLTGNELSVVVDSLQRGKCARKISPQLQRLMSFLADVTVATRTELSLLPAFSCHT